MNNNSHEKKGIQLPVPRLRGNGLIKQLCFAAALTFGAIATPAFANPAPTTNTAPVVSNFTFNVNKGQTVTVVDVVPNLYSDADGDAMQSVQIVTTCQNGTLSINGTAVNSGDVISPADLAIMKYTPNAHFSGTDGFTWNASDGYTYAASNANMGIQVINHAPVVASESINTIENADVNVFGTVPVGFFTDSDNDAMVGIKVTSLPSNGALWLNGQAVQVNDVIATADLAGLVYRPNNLFSGSDQFTVNATDGTDYATSDATMTVTVAHVNFAPSDIALSNASISENMPSGTVVGTVSAAVVDPTTTLSYTLVAGAGDADNGSFAIMNNDQLIATQAFNYEVQSSLNIRLRVEDANGTSYEKAFVIAVQDVVEVPTDIAVTGTYVAENQPVGTLVGSFATIGDEVTATYTYTLTAGAGDLDNANFTINGNQLATAIVCDFETKSEYSIRVRSTDNYGASIEKQVTINVTDANDAPTDIALTNTSVLDHQPVGTVVGDMTTTDQDVADTHTYTLVSGAGSIDNGSFAISGNQLTTAVILNANTQTSYSIRMRSTDAGGLYTEKVFTIDCSHVTQGVTGITLSNAGVNENQLPGAIVGTLSSISQDPGQTYTYSFVQGAGSTGNSFFTINGDVLVTNVSFDYETQSAYTIRVRSTNSNGQHFDKVLPIIIRNVNDVPTGITLTVTNSDENLPTNTAIGFMSTTDQDQGDVHTYTLVNGAGSNDNAHFGINGNKIVAIAPFDYEVQSVYNVRVRTTDSQGAFFEQPFTINVTDVNEAPTAITVATTSIDENMPVGTIVSSLASTDQDRGDTHTYSLVAGAGDADNASFSIAGNQLVANESFNYEAQNQYSIRLRTTDAGGLTFETPITINIINVNDAPVASAMSFSMSSNSTLLLMARNFKHSYADDENSAMAAVKINSLPQDGSLSLGGRAVAVNDVITTLELNSLTYVPNHNFIGLDQFEWSAFDGSLYSTTPAVVSIEVNGSAAATGEFRNPTGRGVIATQASAWTASHQGVQKEGNDVSGIEQSATAPDAMNVSNYPNPFANSATIKYDVPADMHVTVKVFDLTGKEIKTLVDGQHAAGSYTSVWNGNGANMDVVSEGEYIYMVSAKDASGNVTIKTGKMVKMK